MPSYAITQERLKELLHYDEDSGVFTWIKCWNSKKNGTAAGGKSLGYVSIMIDGEAYYAHRLAWFYMFGEWPHVIDHINGDRADNRVCNLRVTDHKENGKNQLCSRTNATGYPGVRHNGRDRCFRARIVVEGKEVLIGLYKTAEEAFVAYMRRKKELYPLAYRRLLASLPDHARALL